MPDEAVLGDYCVSKCLQGKLCTACASCGYAKNQRDRVGMEARCWDIWRSEAQTGRLCTALWVY